MPGFLMDGHIFWRGGTKCRPRLKQIARMPQFLGKHKVKLKVSDLLNLGDKY